jgi:tetratricopeptide (TPR) repeat protein
MRQAATSLPNDTQLLARIGYACRRTGQWSEAVAALQRATELNPHDLYSSTQLLQTLFMIRRFQPALAVAEPYGARYPQDGYFREYLLRLRYALDGDRPRYVRERAVTPPQGNDPHGLRAAYENALLQGDFAAALRSLQDPRLDRQHRKFDRRTHGAASGARGVSARQRRGRPRRRRRRGGGVRSTGVDAPPGDDAPDGTRARRGVRRPRRRGPDPRPRGTATRGRAGSLPRTGGAD